MLFRTVSMFALALALGFGFNPGHAEEAGKTGKPLTAQQSRMKTCNAQARTDGLKGEERKAFMSTCLKGQHSATQASKAAPAVAKAPSAKQEQRKACNAQAKAEGLKGEERKAFVKDCMKRTPADATAQG